MPIFKVNAAWAAMTEVIPNLYICGVSALKPSVILALDFDLIVNCTKEVPNMSLPPDVERLKLWLDDTEETDIGSHLDMAVDYVRMILGTDGRVLVHCVAGVSRSAAVCLAYLVKFENMSLRQAYDHMAASRARVRPNLGFWRQLIEFEKEVRGEASVAIRCLDDQELPDVYYQRVVEDDESSVLTDASNSPIRQQEPALDAENTAQLPDSPSEAKSSESNPKKEERKRQRQLSEAENSKRFIPTLAPLLEVEQ